jgi:hypothetical protein
MQTPLFRYFAREAYARSFVEKGEIYARPLAYFRRFEDEQVRGDPDDGMLLHAPETGLVLTKKNGELIELPEGWRFRASAKKDDILVYCLSQERSESLAAKFESPFCVEVRDPLRLRGRIASSARLRSRLDRRVYSGAVDYRSLTAAPGVDWALPERVAFIKPESWAWQKEHRFVLGLKGAFDVENVECALENGARGVGAQAAYADPLILHIGDLSKITELHRF